MTNDIPAIAACAFSLAATVPVVESPIELMNRLLKRLVTIAEIAMFVNIRNNLDLARTNSPITAQKLNAGKRKMMAEFESIANPASTLPAVREKVITMPKMATASTAEASFSGLGFKFIKTRLIDEFA